MQNPARLMLKPAIKFQNAPCRWISSPRMLRISMVPMMNAAPMDRAVMTRL
jgi:hypothetical protein